MVNITLLPGITVDSPYTFATQKAITTGISYEELIQAYGDDPDLTYYFETDGGTNLRPLSEQELSEIEDNSNVYVISFLTLGTLTSDIIQLVAISDYEFAAKTDFRNYIDKKYKDRFITDMKLTENSVVPRPEN